MRCLRTAVVVMALSVVAAGAAELDQLPLGPQPLAWELGSGGPGTFYDCTAGSAIEFEAMAKAMAGARIVLLGEEHTHLPEKRLQARILDAIAASGRPVVLGMEFFQRGDAGVLQSWSAGEIGEEAFLLASHWYDRGSYNWGYYADVMDVVQKRGIPVVGLNVPRSILHVISRKGLEALDEKQRAVIGTVDTTGSPQHRYLISRYFGDTVAMLPPSWFDRMYSAQCTWDVVMARSILDALPEEGTLVAIAGTGHVAYRLGIARRILEEAARRGIPAPSIVTLCTVKATASEGGEPHGHPMGGHHGGGSGFSPAVFTRSLADYVAIFEDDGGVEAYPTLGFSLEAKDGRILVKRVWPDSAAADSGLRKGDEVLDVAGWTPPDLSHLRLRLASLRWGDRLDVAVRRDEKTAYCRTILEPTLVETERTVAPHWAVAVLPSFAPGEPLPEPIEPGQAAVAAPRYELVSRDGTPVRVEVRLGGLLMAVHELDGGRVARSVYRDPLPDGAVEVVFERDGSGRITGERRLGRDGSPVGS